MLNCFFTTALQKNSSTILEATTEGVKQRAWEREGQLSFNTPGLATAYSLGQVSLSVEICCVGVTVETGNGEDRSHHVLNRPRPAERSEQAKFALWRQLQKHVLTTMSVWAAPLH